MPCSFLSLKVLSDKIAERRRKKAERLGDEQKLEREKLLVQQASDRVELEATQVSLITIQWNLRIRTLWGHYNFSCCVLCREVVLSSEVQNVLEL